VPSVLLLPTEDRVRPQFHAIVTDDHPGAEAAQFDDGLLIRTAHPVVPMKIEYELTQLGMDLGAAFGYRPGPLLVWQN
jgi:hypothetical protein